MFERLALLIDKDARKKITLSKILIVGLGGVGGYALECLIRCGFSNLTLIDHDTFEESNLNRQILATYKTIGLKKVEVAKQRALEINPNINIETIDTFLLENNIYEILEDKFDYIIDACDTISTKISLIEYAIKTNSKIISCMGTGNRVDPLKLQITKLNKTYNDPLAKNVRKILREKNMDFNPYVVWSNELPIKTHTKTPGSLVSVPMQAGNLCASFIINDYINNELFK